MKKTIYKMFGQESIDKIKNGGIGVIPTDTLYSVVCSAFDEYAVMRVSKVKKRSDGKGYIVLVSSIDELANFGVEVSEKAKIFLRKFWPGKVSVILSTSYPKFQYLQKDGAIAFRLPDRADLLEFLRQTGPLIAPSANPEGEVPAKDIAEAKKYFGENVDFYINDGVLESLPSTLVKISGDEIAVIRQGVVNIPIDNI